MLQAGGVRYSRQRAVVGHAQNPASAVRAGHDHVVRDRATEPRSGAGRWPRGNRVGGGDGSRNDHILNVRG